MTTGVYPKTDGEIYYGKDANMAYFQASLGTSNLISSINVSNISTLIILANASRKSILLKNAGTSTIYIGKTNAVTTSTGFPINAGESYYFYTKEAIYGITASTTEDVRFIEVQ